METYKKQKKNRYQLCLLLFNNNVDLKNNKGNWTYRKFVSIWSWYAMKTPMMLLLKKTPPPPLPPFWKVWGQYPRSPAHRRSQGGQRGREPPIFLENIVILCFERRFSKQNSVIRLKSNILPPTQIFGLAKPLLRRSRLPGLRSRRCKESEVSGWSRIPKNTRSRWRNRIFLSDCASESPIESVFISYF